MKARDEKLKVGSDSIYIKHINNKFREIGWRIIKSIMLSTEEKDFSGFFGFTMENMNQYLIKSSS